MIVVEYKSEFAVDVGLLAEVRKISPKLADYMEQLTQSEIIDSGFVPHAEGFGVAFGWSAADRVTGEWCSDVYQQLPRRYRG